MPTYRNNTTEKIIVTEQGIIVYPGDTYETKEILANLYGLTFVSIIPLWNPFIISGEYPGTPSSDITINIPVLSNGLPVINYSVDIASISGSVQVYFTDKDNFGTPLSLVAGCSFHIPVFRRKVDKIILHYVRSGNTRINVLFPEEHEGIIFLT